MYVLNLWIFLIFGDFLLLGKSCFVIWNLYLILCSEHMYALEKEEC